ncbi:hypothetical protein [Georgenia yuyongxinii]|uniref:hypothetical protein n=1 Tax=Georgenia yuyongxinii TaxID=2589797 RepID=UPI00163DB1FB|nr:hypothetical protein [Georgenia yuyongxinii]
MRVTAERGEVLTRPARDGDLRVLLTTHPSAVVRLRGRPEFDAAFEELVADLRRAVE